MALDAGPTPTGPILIQGEKPSFRNSIRSLRYPAYARFQGAQIFLHITVWMQRIAIDWLALELTGSVAVVGLLVFVQWGPMLVLGQWGAVLADRLPRRASVVGAYAAFAVLTAALATLSLLGVLQLWHIVVVAFLIGCVYTIEIPSRVVFFSEMVAQKDLSNAISIYAVVFWIGGVIGPVLGGGLLAIGEAGWCIAAYAAASAGVAITVASLRRSQLIEVPRAAPSRGKIREAISYARSKPTIFWPMVLVASVAVFAMPISPVLAALARDTFHSGAEGYGLYSSLLAVGAVVGATLSTGIRELKLRVIIGLAIGVGVLLTVSSAAPSSLWFCVLLVGAGCLRLLYEVLSDSLVQLSSNLKVRGRIVSLYVAIVAGGQAIGSPGMGLLTDALGPRVALVVAGAVPLCTAIAISIHLARSGSLRVRFRLRRGQSIISLAAPDRTEV